MDIAVQRSLGHFPEQRAEIHTGDIYIFTAEPHPVAGLKNPDPDERERPGVANRSADGGCQNIGPHDPCPYSTKYKMKSDEGCKGYRGTAGETAGDAVWGAG